MKLKSVILTVFAVLLTGQITITGQKIYISPSGNDNDPGTIDRPFASLYYKPFKKVIRKNTIYDCLSSIFSV